MRETVNREIEIPYSLHYSPFSSKATQKIAISHLAG